MNCFMFNLKNLTTMTKKLRALMSVAMAISFLLSCTEDFSYQTSNKEQNETELLLIAKAMVQNYGNIIVNAYHKL